MIVFKVNMNGTKTEEERCSLICATLRGRKNSTDPPNNPGKMQKYNNPNLNLSEVTAPHQLDHGKAATGASIRRPHLL
jgi:hypothetical protein